MTETTPHPPNRRLVPDPPLAPRERSPQRDRPGAGKTKVCVLGAGHGGSAMAAHLTLLGFEVTVCSLFGRELDPIEEAGGVELVGEEVQGFAKYARIERSLDRAVAGQDLIMIAAPGVAHRVYGTLLAPMLADGQAVVLNPGRTGGALEFAQMLTRFACAAEIVLGEVQTFVYAAESRGPASVEILNEKFRVRAAALPATENDRLLGVLQGLYPQMEAGENVLETSINNVGGVVHPTTMLLNSHVLEERAAGADLRFYKNQVTPTIANLVMEPMDAEKIAVGRALGLSELWSVERWYEESYHVDGRGPLGLAACATRTTRASTPPATCSGTTTSSTRFRTRSCPSRSSALRSACRRRRSTRSSTSRARCAASTSASTAARSRCSGSTG